MKTLWPLPPSKKILHDFYVLDTETGVRKNKGIQWCLGSTPDRFIFGCIYGRNYNRVIHSREEFQQVLQEKRFKDKYVFGHNMEYDLTSIYGQIFYLDPHAIFNGKFITATNGNCLFGDSMNIFVGQGVEKIGQQLGIAKPKLGNDLMWSKEVGPNEINRCMTDCVIIWEALIRSFELAGDIRLTQASLSLTYFRRFNLKYPINHNHNTKSFWDSYYGGRTEAFKIGKTHSTVVDVNSMYTWAMIETVFPNPKFLKKEIDFDIKLLPKYLKHYEGLCYCTVIHPPLWLGLLPVKRNGKLLFPIGKFKGCWNFNELRFAIDQGVRVVKVTKIVYSERMKSPFVEFCKTIFALGFGAEDFWKDLYKRYRNSLYGKLAQRITEETVYIDNLEKRMSEVREYQRQGRFIKISHFNVDRVDCHLVLKTEKHKEPSYAIPSFSSYITSYGRIMLAKKLIELKKNRPVYCDTDSIFVEIAKGLKSTTDLGGWKIEKKLVTEIRGLKNYKYIDLEKDKNKVIDRIKGVPYKREKTGDNTYVYSNIVKSKEALRRNIDSGTLIERTKVIKNTYDKREVLTDGTTNPLIL